MATTQKWLQDDRFAIRATGGDDAETVVIPLHQGIGAISVTTLEPGYYRCHTPDGDPTKTITIKHQKVNDVAPTAAEMGLPTVGNPAKSIEAQPSSIRFLIHVSGNKRQISAFWNGGAASTLIMTKVGPPSGDMP